MPTLEETRRWLEGEDVEGLPKRDLPETPPRARQPAYNTPLSVQFGTERIQLSTTPGPWEAMSEEFKKFGKSASSAFRREMFGDFFEGRDLTIKCDTFMGKRVGDLTQEEVERALLMLRTGAVHPRDLFREDDD